jgi:hypothetical protein
MDEIRSEFLNLHLSQLFDFTLKNPKIEPTDQFVSRRKPQISDRLRNKNEIPQFRLPFVGCFFNGGLPAGRAKNPNLVPLTKSLIGGPPHPGLGASVGGAGGSTKKNLKS